MARSRIVSAVLFVSLTAMLLACIGAQRAPARATAPSFAGDFSVTAWIRTTAGGTILSKSSASDVWACGGKSFFVRGGVLGIDIGCVGVYMARTKVADGQWHYVAVTHSRAEGMARFYVDGREDGSARFAVNDDIEGDIVRIGSAAPGFAEPRGFAGEIDEVAVFSRALRPDEVSAPDTATASGYWPLDEGAQDRSGSGRDGYLRGAVIVAGKVGRCASFSGDAAVEIADPSAALAASLRRIDLTAMRLAIDDAAAIPGGSAAKARERADQIRRWERELPQIVAGIDQGDPAAIERGQSLLAFQREALLVNPLLDFDRLLVVRRGGQLGLPQNWQSNACLPQTGYDDALMSVRDIRTTPRLETAYKPSGGRFLGDVDLHWNADRLLFSMPGDHGTWQVFEGRLPPDGALTDVRQIPLIEQPDVENYDACYLPDGGLVFTSTAPFVGVPCVTGSSHVSNCYLRSPTGSIRRLSFGQDHDWCPTVMDDGRVLYQRWEYSDIPHFVSRMLFTMNPDGTNQNAFYGSNSYWPNAMFYARPVPGSATQFAAIVGGHHGVPRMGELVLFDSGRGTHEAQGVVQRIPGRGKLVTPVIRDQLVDASWPKFLHPWPLSDKYFLVAAKPSPAARWGIYLADVFDNLTLICESPGAALLEPIPVKPRPIPPVIPDKVSTSRRDATVSLTDIYAGPGLRGVPRGTVKKLRLFTYQFAYWGVGGQINRVGLDGPWDVKRVVGTVPVQPDGSAHFRVPANTPLSIQPLDAEGKALQLMRSWMTAMPGEHVTCVGCHEKANDSGRNRLSLAARRPPLNITPWYGPTRGFSFRREVQPVLDRHCVPCHSGGAGVSIRPADGPTQPPGSRDGPQPPDFRDGPDVRPTSRDAGYNNGTHFPPSYLALKQWVRGHTCESDIRLLEPGEFSADTTRLVRLLKKGHHGVRLEPEAWDRLITWIDLNTPAHGTWHEIVGEDHIRTPRQRRREMDRKYAGIDEDADAIVKAPAPFAGRPAPKRPAVAAVAPPPRPSAPRLRALAPSRERAADLGSGLRMRLAWVPPGSFVMGDPAGKPDERPASTVRIERGFWMAVCEVTNEQYALFAPKHDSRIEEGDFLQFGIEERGYPVNAPSQPVCRISWDDAMAFCAWLTRRTGMRFTLPTEAQWEYACRAGSSEPLWFGSTQTDFALYANLADRSLRLVDTIAPWGLPSGAVQPWRPVADGVNDRHRVSAPVGSYRANALGIHDLSGNVAEWTRSEYRPYPYRAVAPAGNLRTVRGGSWYDRPVDGRSAARDGYPRWRKVFDVGFRVVCEERAERWATARKSPGAAR